MPLEGSEATTNGTVPFSQVWIGDRIIARDVHGDDLVDVLQQNGDASAWAIAPRTDSAELRRLAKILDLDDLAVAELLDPGHRIGYSEIAGTSLVRLRSPLAAESLLETESAFDLSMIIAEQVLIMLVDDSHGRDLARVLAGAGPRLTRGGADRAAQLAIEATIARLSTITADLEDAGDALAEALFGGEPLSREKKLEAFRLRRSVTELRRIIEPTSEVVSELANSHDDQGPDAVRRWSMIVDHADRAANNVVMLGESLTATFDTSLSLDNARLGELMKRLSGWAAIIAVPTLITSFVGMNVDFWVQLVLMLVTAAVLFIVFRRKDWV